MCGVCSRRNADALIASGRISVNGADVKTMGPDVDEGRDTVCLDGKQISPEEKKVYIMLNKPTGYLSTCRDDRGRKTVLSLVKGTGARLFPVGRLDYNTEGLLILTNDGDFAYRCTHPSHEVNKEYLVAASGNLSDAALNLLRSGIVLDGEKTRPAKVDVIKHTPNEVHTRITIHEGKNRQVRRMFEAVGLTVRSLKRISEGNLELGDLKTGMWRQLTEEELIRLNNLL